MRQKIKSNAKIQLGNNIFGTQWMMALVICAIYSAIVAFAGSTFVGGVIVVGPMNYGLCYVFLKQLRDGRNISFTDMFKGFTEHLTDTLLIGLMTTIFTVLWSFLFIVPGIIKSLGYSMAYYIKIDNPSYDWRKCMDESERMMKGYKGELFILEFSFIGWLIVGSLCAGIGILWVVPYIVVTNAHFYECIKYSRREN